MAYQSILKSKTEKKSSGYQSITKRETNELKNIPVVEKTLPDFLSGGTYKMVPGNPNANIKSDRSTYGGKPTKPGYERADIFPVSLSGVNSSPKNITYEPLTSEAKRLQEQGKDLPIIKTATDKYLMNEILPQYKSGKIGLREAQVKAVSFLRNEQEGLNDEMKNLNLGGKFGELADKVVGFFKGIRAKSDERLKQDISNIATTEARIKQEAQAKIEAEKSLTPTQKIQRNDKLLVDSSRLASEVLGRDIKPENYLAESQKFTPEESLLVRTKTDEQLAEGAANVATMPIRYTAGSLASALVSYGLEKAKSEATYTPQSDAERLLIGENKIKRLVKQEDLYGMVARGVGIPAALVTMAVLENPFIADTGIGGTIKTAIKEKAERAGLEMIVKLGAEELYKIADEVITTETKTGKISEMEAKIARKEIDGLKATKEPLPKPEPVVYENLTAQPSVPTRVANQTIEKGLVKDLGEVEEYTKVSFKDQADKVGQIIDQDPEKAIRIALGQELPDNGALPESVFIAVKNQALKNGDTDLLIKLATEEGGVAKESTVLGQRIKMLDEQLEDDAFKNINEVVKNRRKFAESNGINLKQAKGKEVNNLKLEIKRAMPKVDEWTAFISEITC